MSPRVRYTAFFKFSLKQEKYHRRINYILEQARQHQLPAPRQAMLQMGHTRLKERRCVFSNQEKGAASPTQLSQFPGARQNGFCFLKGQNAIFSFYFPTVIGCLYVTLSCLSIITHFFTAIRLCRISAIASSDSLGWKQALSVFISVFRLRGLEFLRPDKQRLALARPVLLITHKRLNSLLNIFLK